MSNQKMDEERRGMLVGGLITLGIGIFFLLVNLGVLSSIGELWPMFPIIVGVSLIVGAFYKGKKSDESDQSSY